MTYPDSLYFNALLSAISSEHQYIYIAIFLFESSYVGETRARQILEAAKARGVPVYVVLDY